MAFAGSFHNAAETNQQQQQQQRQNVMASELQYSAFVARQDASARYSGILTREDGVTPLPSGTLGSLTLTLTDAETGAVINSRNAQDVFGGGSGANGVAWNDNTAELVWTLAPADNPIVGTGVAEGNYELHQALFVWTWNAGTQRGARKIWINVQQLAGA